MGGQSRGRRVVGGEGFKVLGFDFSSRGGMTHLDNISFVLSLVHEQIKIKNKTELCPSLNRFFVLNVPLMFSIFCLNFLPSVAPLSARFWNKNNILFCKLCLDLVDRKVSFDTVKKGRLDFYIF